MKTREEIIAGLKVPAEEAAAVIQRYRERVAARDAEKKAIEDFLKTPVEAQALENRWHRVEPNFKFLEQLKRTIEHETE